MELSINHDMNMRYQIGNHYEFGEYGDVSYIPIPKCASSAITQAILNCSKDIKSMLPEAWDYKISHDSALQDEIFFTVIRNPMSRWISGCNEYIANNMLNNQDAINKLYNTIENGQLVFDEHTLPMSEFLKGFNDIKYFSLTHNVISEINSYYDLQLEYNIVNGSKYQHRVLNSLQKITETMQFRKNFQITYNDDLALWQNR